MGSTGSGTFSDYSQRPPKSPEDTSGGSSGADKCQQAFESALEDVGRCFYYMNHNRLPPVQTSVVLTFNGVRLAVETEEGEELGYLPTSRNYLKACLDNGFGFIGSINSSSTKPTPSIRVDFYPQ